MKEVFKTINGKIAASRPVSVTWGALAGLHWLSVEATSSHLAVCLCLGECVDADTYLFTLVELEQRRGDPLPASSSPVGPLIGNFISLG